MIPKLEFITICKTFNNRKGQVEALRDFSLKVFQGELIAFLGESGCGKSTLLDLAAGLLFPTSGTVLVDGSIVKGPNKKTGVVFQGYPLIGNSSVYDNIAIGYKIRKEVIPEDRILKIIEKVGLSKFEHAKPSTLSGGMAQRAALARAIVASPELLLLDEPFAALDALTKRELQDEVRKISTEEKMTTVMITHDFDEAVRIADRIVLLTPRPGSKFKEYRNEVGNEVMSLTLRKKIVDDIYSAREASRRQKA